MTVDCTTKLSQFMILANLALSRSKNYDCKVRCKLKRTFMIVNYDRKTYSTGRR